MKSALESFSEIQAEEKMAILGDMLELGAESVSEHQAIIDLCHDLNIPFVTVGPIFKGIHPGGFENQESFRAQWPENNLKNHLILLKGSRGIALEKLMDLF
jgi:UDP-N-acetylmuramoyl-tripeptide--D-alanyl-D-alanine ligase